MLLLLPAFMIRRDAPIVPAGEDGEANGPAGEEEGARGPQVE